MTALAESARAKHDALRADILNNRMDWHLQAVYSDWLEDHDYPAAEVFVWRWLAKRQRTPHERSHYTHVRTQHVLDGVRVPYTRTSAVPEKVRWGWYPEWVMASSIDPHPTEEARLEPLVFQSLHLHGHDHLFCGSFWLAIEALAAGLERLRLAREI